MTAEPDVWARWITRGRDAGDEQREADTRRFLAPVRDRVLAGARLAAGETLLDVGTGDGLIAFGAFDRVGPTGTVVFSDVSADLLAICRARVGRLVADGVAELPSCRYVRTAADALALADGTAHAVTTRSVLIYVLDKQRAFDEMFRVLAPDGRLSIFEPINRFGHPEPEDRLWGYDIGPVRALADRVKAAAEAARPPLRRAMVDFDERDLLGFAERAGFVDLRMTYEVHVSAEPFGQSGGAFASLMDSAPNPLSPTFRQMIDAALDPDEAATLTAHLRSAFDNSEGTWRRAAAYLTALKPGRLRT